MGKRRGRGATAPKATADLGTAERADRQGGILVGARVITEGGVVLHNGARAANASVIEAMLRARLLDGTQGGNGERRATAQARFEAAERLHRLFVDAGLHQLKAVDPNRQAPGDSEDVSDKCAAARQRFNRIVRQLGPWMHCLTTVVLHDEQPSSAVIVRNVCGALDLLCQEFKL